MKIGRNAPGHCGSGKKYKQCCRRKDEEARRAAPATPIEPAVPAPRAATPLPVPTPPPDPRIAAWHARWEAFEASDYAGQMVLFQHTLDEPDLMDGEMAFEMLNKLFPATVEHDERERFEALVQCLRDRRPEIYDEEAHYCLDWLMTNALVAQRGDRAPALAREMAALAGNEIDMWYRGETQLAYHGQLSVLVEAMRLAWPQARRSTDIVSWGIDEFAHRAIGYELLEYAERTPVPEASDPALLARLHVYNKDIVPERVAAYLAHLTGQAQRQWTMRDFAFAPPRRRSRHDWDEEEEDAPATAASQSPSDQNFYDLSIEFLGYLHCVEGVPYTKGELGRRELAKFILERHAGELEYQESMLESLQRDLTRRHGRKLPSTPKFRKSAHPLVPDHERLDRFLGGLLQLLNQLYYHTAALFELIPAWLRFLESCHLIDAALRVQTLRDIESLVEPLCQVCGNFADDPTLQQALLRWCEDAAQAPPR